jgi:hypothetical protein
MDRGFSKGMRSLTPQLEGEDYMITEAVITYTVAPRATDFHSAWYTH